MRPIRVYLLVLVLGVMLPGVLLTGILVWRSFVNTRAITERRLIESARVDASALDREFDSAISVLQTLATSPSLDRDDLAAFYQEARRGQATQRSTRKHAAGRPRSLVGTRCCCRHMMAGNW